MSVNWNNLNKEERAKLVRFYLLDKLWTYGQLANYLGVTRNVIAGVCNRAGIKIPKNKPKPLPASPEPAGVDNVVLFPLISRPNREEAVAEMAKKLKAKRTNSAQSAAVQRMAGRELDMESLFVRDPRPLREEYWKPLPNSSPIRLENTNAHHCRWPVSEDNHQCCGNPAKPGKPYCDTHCEIAYRPAPVLTLKRRKAEKAA